MKIQKQLSIVVLLMAAVLAFASIASAFDGTIVKSIEINNKEVFRSAELGGSSDYRVDSLSVEKGELLEIDVRLEAPDNEDVKNLEVTARMVHEYSDRTPTYDSSSLFEIDAGDTEFKTLKLRVPKDTDEQTIDLHILILDRSNVFTQDITLHVKGKRHDVEITRLLFTPENVVKAGSFLIGKVRLENYGDKDEDDLLVRAWVEGLEGASDSDIIDVIESGKVDESGESITSEELYLPIPLCAESGLYTVKVEAFYDNDRSKQTAEWEIMVEESNSEVCTKSSGGAAQTTPVVVGGAGQAQTVMPGGNIGIPVTITNAGSAAQTYIVSGDAAGWAAVRYEPSNVLIVQPGQTATAFVYADVLGDAQGTKWLAVNVKSGSEVVSQSTLQINVQGEQAKTSGSVKKTLEWILIILVILIVILGLIVGINRLKSNDDEEEDDGKTYY